MEQEHETGWYKDPFRRHEARWMADGQPTKLVRDQGLEAHDDPPDEPPSRKPVKVEAPDTAGPDDLKRADDAEAGPDERSPDDGAWEVFPQTFNPF